jgi:hypothetical protein
LTHCARCWRPPVGVSNISGVRGFRSSRKACVTFFAPANLLLSATSRTAERDLCFGELRIPINAAVVAEI